jgi:hypothetical protein
VQRQAEIDLRRRAIRRQGARAGFGERGGRFDLVAWSGGHRRGSCGKLRVGLESLRRGAKAPDHGSAVARFSTARRAGAAGAPAAFRSRFRGESAAVDFIHEFQWVVYNPLWRFCNGWPKKQRRPENPLA